MFEPVWWRGFSFFLDLGTSSPELSTDKLRRRFFGVADGSETISVAEGVEAAAGSVAGGDGLVGGKSNGSGVGMGSFLVLAQSMLMMVEAWN